MHQSSSDKEILRLQLWDFFNSLFSKNIQDAEIIKKDIIEKVKDLNIEEEIYSHPEVVRRIPDAEARHKFVEVVFLNEVEINDEILLKLGEHINESYMGNDIDIDKLYQYNMAHQSIVNEYFSTDILSGFLSDTSKHQLHEAQAVIYFYLEAFDVKRSDIEEIKKECKNDDDLIFEILDRINKSSLMSPSFEITDHKGFYGEKLKKVTFKSKSGGLPDVLLYNNKKTSFTLGFATLKQNSSHEGASIIKHPVVVLGIINSLIENKKEIQLNKYSNEKTRQTKSVEKIQSYIGDIYQDKIKELFLGKRDKTKFETVFKKYNSKGSSEDINELFSEVLGNTNTESINGFIEKINKKGIKFQTFFLGDIKSPKSKVDKIKEYTPEEFLVLLTYESFISSFPLGAGDLQISQSNVSELVDLMELRFKTVNSKKSKTINLKFINNEKKKFLPIYVDEFLLKKDRIGDNFPFAGEHFENMSIVDSKIFSDLADYISNKVFSTISNNIANAKPLDIDQMTSSFFSNITKNNNIKFNELVDIVREKYKKNLSDKNYLSITGSIKRIKDHDNYIQIHNQRQSNQNRTPKNN